jgi:hypothetical protein
MFRAFIHNFENKEETQQRIDNNSHYNVPLCNILKLEYSPRLKEVENQKLRV